MIEYNFYNYYGNEDKIKIYCEDLCKYFIIKNIIINSIDFDKNKNVILNIEKSIDDNDVSSHLEKTLLKEIYHLNDIEIKNSVITLIFDSMKIELC